MSPSVEEPQSFELFCLTEIFGGEKRDSGEGMNRYIFYGKNIDFVDERFISGLLLPRAAFWV